MSFEWLYYHWFAIAALAFLASMALAHFNEASKRKHTRIFSLEDIGASEASRKRRLFIWLFRSLAIMMCAISLAEPRFGVEIREISRKGRDLVFVLDVSKSMLASDVAPNRLKRAKADIIEGVRQMTGHRLGLIAFAGSPKEVCPLTYDYYHFINRLKDITPDSIPLGGTNIGDALRKALDLIESGVRLGNYKDVVLITDGQDLEGFYEEVAKEAGVLGVSVYTIGIGQAEETDIRLADGTYLKNDGKVVKTALNPEPLQVISQMSGGGFYQNLIVSPKWLDKILQHIEAKEQARTEMDKQERKIPRYYIFLSLALCFLSISFLIPERRKQTLA